MSDYQPSEPDEHGVENCSNYCDLYMRPMLQPVFCGMTGQEDPVGELCIPWLWRVLEEHAALLKYVEAISRGTIDPHAEAARTVMRALGREEP